MFLRLLPVTVLTSFSTTLKIFYRTDFSDFLSLSTNVRSLEDKVILNGLSYEITGIRLLGGEGKVICKLNTLLNVALNISPARLVRSQQGDSVKCEFNTVCNLIFESEWAKWNS